MAKVFFFYDEFYNIGIIFNGNRLPFPFNTQFGKSFFILGNALAKIIVLINISSVGF